MTRPNIVRADTIDLQDQDNPTAAEHQKPSLLQGGIAAHQRAEVHHVLEERDSEEHALQDAWNITDNLTDEPGAIDETQQQHGTQPATNGTHEGEEGDEGGESEADDEMMDRISSSPSIDDGGYILHSSPPVAVAHPIEWQVAWPERNSSLSPSPRDTPTPTRETFNQSASSSPGSSPFLQTPQHLPLHVRRSGKIESQLDSRPDWSSSPFDDSPRHLPPIRVEQADDAFPFSSKHHHGTGRYRPSLDQESIPAANEELVDGEEGTPWIINNAMGHQNGNKAKRLNKDDDQASENSVLVHNVESVKRPFDSPFRKDPFARSLTNSTGITLEPSPSLTSIGSVDLQDVLLPVDDPLLDTPPSPSDSSGSWESLPTEEDSLDQDLNDDDTDTLFHDLEDRFIDSGWGGECLRETEDIDFEFVYALHTFVATVEGQANATKGDTMVLLDDSNSYWWLVRVVKDNSIGYLPAEHIETPTERLARLNKHRNIDLSATMLSDNSEKSRNPLKKAMRRRNAKTVQFAAPTYVEASDYEYETEDEDQPMGEPDAAVVQPEETQQNGVHSEVESTDDDAASQDEPARSGTPTRLSFDREQAATIPSAAEDPQTSPKLVDKTEAAPLKSRKTRNTDSFLKDDSIETRKITLTPGLLREDGTKSTSSDSDRNNSLDNLVKQVSPPEQPNKKDAKKEKKEKKGGMLSGLFKSKKKDKKSKEDITDQGDENPSAEILRESPRGSPLTSGRTSPSGDSTGVATPPDMRRQEVQTRQPSRGKLQKAPPAEVSSPARETQREPTREKPEEQPRSFTAELEDTEAIHEVSSTGLSPIDTQTTQTALAAQDDKQKEGALSPITNILKRDDSKTQKPAKAKRSKRRVELDDFDSPTEDNGPNPFKEQEERAAAADEEDGDERLSSSPVEISHNTFMHGTESIHIPTPSPYDVEDEEEEDEDEDPESLTSSPSIIEHPAEPVESNDRQAPEDNDSTPTGPRSPQPAPGTSTNQTSSTPNRGLSTDSTATSSTTHLSPATTVSQPSWSDSSLRAWLEDGSEVKDMMTMIYDKSGVRPVSDDHPMMAGLYTDQKKGVQDMMGQLDGLLGSYLQRKGIALG